MLLKESFTVKRVMSVSHVKDVMFSCTHERVFLYQHMEGLITYLKYMYYITNVTWRLFTAWSINAHFNRYLVKVLSIYRCQNGTQSVTIKTLGLTFR